MRPDLSSRRAWPVWGLVLTLGFGLACRPTEEQAGEKSPPATVETPAAAEPGEVILTPANLYFPDDTGHLTSETVDLPAGPTETRIIRLVEALIAGPKDTTGVLHAPLPKETTVGGVLVLDAIAYVDLRGAEGGPPPAVGSMDEQMILYSLVDTIVLNNSPAIERVVLLWNGSQRETFAGHFDTTRPLSADLQLVSGR